MNTSVDNEKRSSADDHLAGRETMCETGGLSINATENGPNCTLIRVNSGLENGSQAVVLQRFRIKTPRISNDPASSVGGKDPNGWQVKSLLENDFRRIGPLSKTRVWVDAPDNWKKKKILRPSDGGYDLAGRALLAGRWALWTSRWQSRRAGRKPGGSRAGPAVHGDLRLVEAEALDHPAIHLAKPLGQRCLDGERKGDLAAVFVGNQVVVPLDRQA
jgi:hypothetical protein